MTNNEIIKALQRCFIVGSCSGYTGCPLKPKRQEDANCIDKLVTNTIDLIKRQQAEIEELKAKRIEDDELLQKRVSEAVNVVDKANQRAIDLLEEIVEDKKAELKKAKAEIDRLQDLLDATIAGQETLQRHINVARAEVIKEFVARLRQEGHVQLPSAGYPIDEDDWVIYKEDVDYIEKEMTNKLTR